MNSFGNIGATCVATKRIFVHRSIYACFRKTFVEAVKALKVGHPSTEPDVMIGPVQNKPQYEKIKEFLNDIEREHSRVVVGAKKKLDDWKY